MKIRKAVIPVAGIGTRFLPATKAVPKALLPVLDTPPLHYVVQEAVDAGIEHIILVVSERQESIRRYFENSGELKMPSRPGNDILERIQAAHKTVHVSYINQDKQLGLGHAILSTKSIIGDEMFAVLLPDDLIWNRKPVIGQMAELTADKDRNVIALKEVSDELVSSLGIVNSVPIKNNTCLVTGLVEKPSLKEAPSNLGIVGRYILTPQIFEMLSITEPGAGGEIQVTDALSKLLGSQDIYGYRFQGSHFDVGIPIGLLKASVYEALKREALKDEFRSWLNEII